MDFAELDAHLQSLTAHQLKIVQTVYNAGGSWLTRSKVAKALGKRRLTPYDIDCLKKLTDIDLIETSTQPTTAPGSEFAYIYHMCDDVAVLLQEWSERREQETQDQSRKPINLVDDNT